MKGVIIRGLIVSVGLATLPLANENSSRSCYTLYPIALFCLKWATTTITVYIVSFFLCENLLGLVELEKLRKLENDYLLCCNCNWRFENLTNFHIIITINFMRDTFLFIFCLSSSLLMEINFGFRPLII